MAAMDEEVLVALGSDVGSWTLQRLLNRSGPIDFRGQLGARAWAAAVGAGNWRGAALIAQGGYRPPGQESLADFLLEHFLDTVDFRGQAPFLMLAAACDGRRNPDEPGPEHVLLKLGAPWSAQELNACLFVAAQRGRAGHLIGALIEAGGDLEARLDQVQAFLSQSSLVPEGQSLLNLKQPGATPLLVAASAMNGRVGDWLDCGADPEAVDAQGRTALHRAIAMGRADHVRALLRAGADPERPDKKGKRPLVLALESNGPVLDALLEAAVAPLSADQDIQRAKGGALLRLYRRRGESVPTSCEGARALLKIARSRWDPAALQQAVAQGFWELLDLQLLAGGNPTGLLGLAAQQGHVGCVRTLLAAGVDLEERDSQGNTPLLCARRPEVSLALLEAGAQAGVANDQGETALHCTRDYAVPAAAALVAAGTPVQEPDRYSSWTPLQRALYFEHQELALTLLQLGADANLSFTGMPPWAMARCRPLLEALLEAGAQVRGGPEVATGLHLIVSTGSPDMLERVLQAGAEIESPDPKGATLLVTQLGR